jgi:hypothetical protein
MDRRGKLVIGILLGIASVLIAPSACDRMLEWMLEETVDLPAVISGKIDWDRTGPTALTSSQVTTIANWMAQHRSGWYPEWASLGSGVAVISLDTAAREGAVRLTLWPSPDRPMIIEYQADMDIAIKGFSCDEWAAMREIVGIVPRLRNCP